MKLLAILLACSLLLNLIVGLWPSPLRYSAHLHMPDREIALPMIRLGFEVKPELVAEDDVESIQRCFRLGPFLSKKNYVSARSLLQEAAVSFYSTEREQQQADVYRVFLGPYRDIDTVQQMRDALKRKQIIDHFVRKMDDGQFVISLGIYSHNSGAMKAAELLRDKLDQVRLRRERTTLPNSYWLSYSLPQESALIAQYRSAEWGENSVRVGRLQCPAINPQKAS